MDVFLSWSGNRSRKAAEAFYNWLPDVLQSVRPWMSSEDICSGSGWNQQIRSALNKSNFGIVFVTRDNRESTWLMFEAGALAKHVDEARVVPLIVDDELTPVMLSGPLAQLQAREANEDKIRRLIRDINFSAEVRLSDDRVDRCFDANWHRLKSRLDDLPDAEGEKPELNQNAMIEQILTILRSESRKNSPVVLGGTRETDVDKLARKRLNLRLDAIGAQLQFREKVLDFWETILPDEIFVSFKNEDGDEVKVFKSGDINVETPPPF